MDVQEKKTEKRRNKNVPRSGVPSQSKGMWRRISRDHQGHTFPKTTTAPIMVKTPVNAAEASIAVTPSPLFALP